MRILDANPAWGVADEMAGTESDPIERDLQTCSVTQGAARAWLALRSRLREQKSIESLRGLVAAPRRPARVAQGGDRRHPRAGGCSRANQPRMTDEGTKGRIVGLQPLGVGPDGVSGRPIAATSPVMRAPRRATASGCRASIADSQQMFQDLIGEANRSSTSFYTRRRRPACGPRRGRAPTTPLEAQLEARNRERMPFTTTLDSIRTLGGRDQRHGHRRQQRLQDRPAAHRRRLQRLLPARLHVVERQGRRQVPQDQGRR